jgi:hypothetical protein
MLKIDRVAALARGLPKWPQCLITGPAVTPEQAKDIIFRTDYFLQNFSPYAGGNNHAWNEWARQELGYDLITKLNDYGAGGEWTDERRERQQKVWQVEQELKHRLKMVVTEYVTNSWASCAYIYGPYGWCHPDGRIYHCDNVGKWPEVKEVATDLETIGAAFPYVKLWLTLMNAEQGEPNSAPVVTMLLENGEVTFHEGTLEPFEGVPRTRGQGAIESAALQLVMNRRREQGLPDSWIREFGQATKPLIKELIAAGGL